MEIRLNDTKLHYLENDNLQQFEDVRIVGTRGKKFKINRSVLVSHSNFLHKIIIDLENDNYILNEEFITIITEIPDFHLEKIMDYLFYGNLYPNWNELKESFTVLGILINNYNTEKDPVEGDNYNYDQVPSPLVKIEEKINESRKRSKVSNNKKKKKVKLKIKEEEEEEEEDCFDDHDDNDDIIPNDFSSYLDKDEIDVYNDTINIKSTQKVSYDDELKKLRNTLKKKTKNDFFCPFCNLWFDDESKFKPHKFTHIQGVFKCVKCNELFRGADPGNYMMHIRKEHEFDFTQESSCPFGDQLFDEDSMPIIKCTYCQQTFKIDSPHILHHLGAHFAPNPGIDKYKCWFCDSWFSTFEDITKHFRTHRKQYIHCPICHKRYSNIKHKMFAMHVDSHSENPILKGIHPPKPNCCGNCGSIYTSGDAYKNHLATNPFHTEKCNYAECIKQLKCYEERKDHIDRVHKGLEIFKCGTCGEIFNHVITLRDHIRSNHAVKKEAKTCPHCNKKVIGLSYHISQEHRESSVACEECGEVMKTQRAYKRHKIIVHGQKYTCEICGKVFNMVNRFNRHKLVHLEEKDRPFQCEICHKGFMDKTRFNHHMNVHNGIKPYTCKYCGLGFADGANKIAHEKSVHLGIKRGSKNKQPTNT